MISRLKYLDQKHQEVNQRLKEWHDAPFVDPQSYQALVDEYESIARERTWLYDVFNHVPMRIEHDSYEERRFEVQIRVQFAKATIVSPFNHYVYALEDQRAATMDLIHVGEYGYTFTYSTRVIRNVNPLQIAEEITRSYVRAVPELDEITSGIYFANMALRYIQQSLRGSFAFENESTAYRLANLAHQFPVSEKPYGYFVAGAYTEIERATPKDDMLKRLSESAGKYWPMACKVMAYALLDNKFEVNWKPFGNLSL